MIIVYPQGYTNKLKQLDEGPGDSDMTEIGLRGITMATKGTPHLLTDERQLSAITKRAKRAHGQMGAIVRMLEEGRSCEDIATQMAAVAKAVNTAAVTLISASLKECLVERQVETDDIVLRMQKLFLSLA